MELQFYPNSITTGCTAGGGYTVTYSANAYTACSPVWEVSMTGYSESAAFNAMLTDTATGGPLVMRAGDTITDHQYIASAKDGMHSTYPNVRLEPLFVRDRRELAPSCRRFEPTSMHAISA